MWTPLMGGSDCELVAKMCEHDHGGEGKKTFGGESLIKITIIISQQQII